MKIDRLIGILSILLQQEQVTAPVLAEKFEVSKRTINRDIEALCMAGIPIVTKQGQGGGISIMDGYHMDKTLLTSRDMQAILTGLKSLDSVSGTNRYQQLMDKVTGGSTKVLPSNEHIRIDLSSWYKNSLPPKITKIQQAIEDGRRIQFSYYGPKGQRTRCIEPYYLLFQWSSWYVWGYCLTRKAYRMFKLTRMEELVVMEEWFEQQQVEPPEFVEEEVYPKTVHITALFSADMKWRLIEDYGRESIEERDDGSLLFEGGFTSKENLFGWLLTFQDQVELVSPETLREEYKELLHTIIKKYSSSK